MHAELFQDSVRRSREEEVKLRRRADHLRALTRAALDPATAAAFHGAAQDRERRANEYHAFAAEFEHRLRQAGEQVQGADTPGRTRP